MEDPVFRMYVAQTKSVFDELDFLDFEEIGFANIAVDRIIKMAANDARSDNLQENYSDTVGHITVAARARLSGTKIYVVLVHVGSDGDWDPDGCDGLDHIAYYQNHEIATAFVTFIGGRPLFRWIKRKPRQWSNFIGNVPRSKNVETGEPNRIQDEKDSRCDLLSGNSLLFGLEIESNQPVDSQMRMTLFKSGLLPLEIRKGTKRMPSAGKSPTSQHALLRDAIDLSGSRAGMPGTTSADASWQAMLGTSLPPGSGQVEFGPELLSQKWFGDWMKPNQPGGSQSQ
ncbi:MAG: hypothetical protein KJ587_15755 [Alphaproteobacteria bacterium]|nr:hypothetical protein [Alphaproteobacteria bacterium]